MVAAQNYRTALSLIAVSLLTIVLAGCSKSSEPAPRIRPAMVVQPQPSSLSFTVYPGEVRARHEAALGFRVGGKIARRAVDVGAQVKAGEVLAELDPDDLKLQAEAARAQLAAAEADLALSRNELDRHRTLLGRKLISQSLFDTRDSQFKAAKARLAQVQAQWDVAKNQASYATLRANVDGVVAQRLAEVGQVVGAGQTVFVVAATGEREIAISLPESDIAHYQLGQDVLITPWSNPQQRIPGTLRELAPAADAAARTYAARVQIEGEVEGLELGQSARAIFARDGGQALAVPLPAVTAEAGRNYVWVLQASDSTVHRREVSIGPFLDEAVPITSGLAAGDWVVAAGVHLLREGQIIQPVDRDNRPVNLTPAG